jgi:hypothetical protein
MEELEQNRPRSLDGLHIAAVVCVAALIVGEVALLVWVFHSHRSRGMRVQVTELVEMTPTAKTNATATASTLTAFSGSVTARTAMATQPVLNPALKIQRIQRDGAALQVRLRAQTGEPEFVALSAQVSVEWHLADGSARLEWIAVPVAWENLAVKTLAARYDGPSALLCGCTVRTFYRQQLQDMMITEISTP